MALMHGEYLVFRKRGGDLYIGPTTEGIEEAEECLKQRNYDCFYDLLEEHLGNGWSLIPPEALGAMTDAPILSEDFFLDDDGEWDTEDADLAVVYWHTDYMVENPVETWAEGGEVRFRGSRSPLGQKIEKFEFSGLGRTVRECEQDLEEAREALEQLSEEMDIHSLDGVKPDKLDLRKMDAQKAVYKLRDYLKDHFGAKHITIYQPDETERFGGAWALEWHDGPHDWSLDATGGGGIGWSEHGAEFRAYGLTEAQEVFFDDVRYDAETYDSKTLLFHPNEGMQKVSSFEFSGLGGGDLRHIDSPNPDYTIILWSGRHIKVEDLSGVVYDAFIPRGGRQVDWYGDDDEDETFKYSHEPNIDRDVIEAVYRAFGANKDGSVPGNWSGDDVEDFEFSGVGRLRWTEEPYDWSNVLIATAEDATYRFSLRIQPISGFFHLVSVHRLPRAGVGTELREQQNVNGNLDTAKRSAREMLYTMDYYPSSLSGVFGSGLGKIITQVADLDSAVSGDRILSPPWTIHVIRSMNDGSGVEAEVVNASTGEVYRGEMRGNLPFQWVDMRHPGYYLDAHEVNAKIPNKIDQATRIALGIPTYSRTKTFDFSGLGAFEVGEEYVLRLDGRRWVLRKIGPHELEVEGPGPSVGREIYSARADEDDALVWEDADGEMGPHEVNRLIPLVVEGAARLMLDLPAKNRVEDFEFDGA